MQSSEWAGRVGDAWAEEWRRTDRSFEPIDVELLAQACAAVEGMASPRILDIGCGAGTTSLKLAERLPSARITGIDLSDSLVAIPRRRAEETPTCRFDIGDASVWSREKDFDLLVSRHGVMFFGEPVSALAHLRSLARPGGQLVFSCFRAATLNLWASALQPLFPAGEVDPRAPGPFAFADEAYVADLLAAAGWRSAAAAPLDFEYVAGGGDDPVADALDYLRRIGPVARALRDLDEPRRTELAEALERLVSDHRRGDRVAFPAAAWIWSATA